MRMIDRLRSDEGAMALVVVAVVAIAAFGLAMVVLDMGSVETGRREMQTAADAGALAGVQFLPGDMAVAESAAREFAQQNGADPAKITVAFSGSPPTSITVDVGSMAPVSFAQAFGTGDQPVGASAVAALGSPTAYNSGLMPFGIIASGTVESPYGYSAGQLIKLVVDNGEKEQGNWHYVDLTPFTDGASNTKQVIGNGGTTDPVAIGDIIYTQTGSPTNPNFNELTSLFARTCAPHGIEALEYDPVRGIYSPTHAADGSHCNRLIVCPVIVINQGDPYAWDSVNGTTQTRVVGFLNMLVTNDPAMKDDNILWGLFVQVVAEDALAPGAYVPYAGIMTWLER